MAYSFKQDNFAKMLLVSPTGLGGPDGMPSGISTWVRWLAESPVVGTSLYNLAASRLALGGFLRRNLSERYAKTAELVDSFYYPAHRGDTKYAFAASVSGFLNVDIASKLSKMTIPVHVVWGTDNSLNPIENFDIITRHNPDIGLTPIEGARLMPHMEFPKEFCRACIRFFG
jgi:pimeloyl-ACP methyl ester carboxylesterase